MIPKTPSFRLDNKTALVTGATGSIGFACACALAEYGAKVTIVGRDQKKINESLSLMHDSGYDSDGLCIDMANIDMIASALSNRPADDIILDSAGLARHSLALDTKESDYDTVMNINVKSAYFLSTITAKKMIDMHIKGSIIHISSQMGHVGGQERAVYCASNHALEGMIKTMATEWGQYGIRINSIAPTFVKTALTAKTFEDESKLAWINSKIALRRIGNVEDIMGAAVFLASDAASLVTGTSLKVDGGWTAA